MVVECSLVAREGRLLLCLVKAVFGSFGGTCFVGFSPRQGQLLCILLPPQCHAHGSEERSEVLLHRCGGHYVRTTEGGDFPAKWSLCMLLLRHVHANQGGEERSELLLHSCAAAPMYIYQEILGR